MSTSRTREKADGELFKSTGIDDNATSTAVTIDANENVGIGAAPAANVSMTISADGSGSTLAGVKIIDTNSGNDHQIYNQAGNLYFRDTTAGLTRLVINNSGSVGINTASPAKPLDVTGDIRTSTGILFGTDTAAANTLDDYEEGTWTPYFTSINSTAPTGNMVHAGSYTKVGRVVNLIGYMQITSGLSVGGGTLAIAGLPFPAVTSNGYNAAGFVGVHSNWDPARYPNGGLSFYTTVALGFLTANHDSAWSWEQTNTLNNQTHMRWSITYFTS